MKNVELSPAKSARDDKSTRAEDSTRTAADPASGPRPSSLLSRLLAYRVLWAIALVVLGFDQLTKSWIASRLPFGSYGPSASIEVIRHFCYFVHVGNTGAAWSMFTGASVVLAILAATTLVAIFVWRRALGLHDRLTQVCFGLLCGGITGNLFDRLLHGHVIDFIDLHFGSYVYPTFNVADSGICIGVVLYLWHGMQEK